MKFCCSEERWSEIERIVEKTAIPKYTLNVPKPENRLYIEYEKRLSNEINSEMDSVLNEFKKQGLIKIETREHFYDLDKEIMEIFRS